MASYLLYQADAGEGKIFIQRAITMLTIIFLAASRQEIAPFPYLRFLIRLGLADTAAHLYSLDPTLATRFLDTKFLNADLKDKFLLSCWGSLVHPLQPILTETVICSLTRSDFTPTSLMTSAQPKTVYIRWKEQDLLPLAPLNRLYWGSWINELTTVYDRRQGCGCKPVLLLIDEGGRTAIPNLYDAASTVCGRGVSIWLAVQSLEQLSAVYGHDRANILRGNCETQLCYRPNDLTTARYLEDRLGFSSGYSRSKTLHHGDETSEGFSECPIPLLASQDIGLLTDKEVIAWHRNYRPLKLKRMNWLEHPVLVKRRNIPPPKVWPLSPPRYEEIRTGELIATSQPVEYDDELINPDEVE